jgi:cell division septation protein DedD
MLEPIAPAAKETRFARFEPETTQQTKFADQPQLSPAAAQLLGNSQPLFAEETAAARRSIPPELSLYTAFDESDFVEESQDIEYPDLEISYEPPEEEIMPMIERVQPPALPERATNDSDAALASHEWITQQEPETAEAESVGEAQDFYYDERSDDEAFEAEAAHDTRRDEQTEVTNQASSAYDEAQAADEAEIPAANYDSATDPWKDPLPAWEYSQNEWPVALAPDNTSLAKKLRIPIAAALVVVMAVAAYFLLFQQGADSEQNPLVVSSETATEKPNRLSGQAAEPSPASALRALENKQPSPRDEAAADDTAQGRFTLQLASMPDEQAAHAMAERLKADGLPAYVVSADLGRRGMWFRVRVGRFETAEEARTFAAKSRLEAKVEPN